MRDKSNPWIFLFAGNNQQSIFGMGCATETACNLKDVEAINNIKIRTFCTDVSSGSPQLTSIISSILTALFLLKREQADQQKESQEEEKKVSKAESKGESKKSDQEYGDSKEVRKEVKMEGEQGKEQ
ncbi:hypothetical protein P7K49_035239 [Saguinus oedipus]|uniref:Uncharacterized protein n=1 Tax=Saguinus oedipus TaxID=9490 RepID=A0ABQ9TM23_SAGOE|nr:hypothetical protein P7K49_035239 [Saguinus oedipus]